MKSKATVEQLLMAADDIWVCPLTGTKFKRSDADVIEKHKAKLIEDARIKEEIKTKEAQFKQVKSKGRNIKTLDDFKTWVTEMSSECGVKINNLEIKPYFSPAIAHANGGTTTKFSDQYVGINFANIKKNKAALKKIGISPAGDVYVIEVPASPFKNAITALVKNSNKHTVNHENIDQLYKAYPEYGANVAELKTLRNAISDLKEKVRSIEKENANYRDMFIKGLQTGNLFDSL